MESNDKNIELKNIGIDLTETGTIGKPVKFDNDNFHPDSIEYWMMGGVSSEEKERILLEKVNQFETHYRFFSLEHIVETVFKSSEYRFKKKKEDIESHLELLPNRKEQIIDDEKQKVYNDIKSWKSLTSGKEPSDDCFLDFEQSKEIFLEYTFPWLGYESVKEIENYLLSLIAYRGNLLYINYLKQLFTPDQVEECKIIEQPPIIKDEVNGIPCIEFDNLFGADFVRKNEVWQYMKLLGMIDNEGTYLLPNERAIIRAFVMVMKKNGKFTPTAEEGFLIRVLGLKLLADNKVRVRTSKKIEDKQNEIVAFLNNHETKNKQFVNVD